MPSARNLDATENLMTVDNMPQQELTVMVSIPRFVFCRLHV